MRARTTPASEPVVPRRYSVEGDAIPHLFSLAERTLVIVVLIVIMIAFGILMGLAPLYISMPWSLACMAGSWWCTNDHRRYPHPSVTVIYFAAPAALLGGVSLTTMFFVHFRILEIIKLLG